MEVTSIGDKKKAGKCCGWMAFWDAVNVLD